jgi:hypothetical protein
LRVDISSKMMIRIAISLCAFLPNSSIAIFAAPAPSMPEDIGGAAVGNSTIAPSNETSGAAPEEIGGLSGSSIEDVTRGKITADAPELAGELECSSEASTMASKTNVSSADNSERGSPFTLNSVLISKDLSNLSSSEIKDYRGLAELPTQEIHSVLCMLTPGNITKVLMNIPPLELQGIKVKLNTANTPSFENILASKHILGDNRTQILNRTGQ